MGKTAELFEFMRKCPGLEKLWSIGTTEATGESVILPQGASEKVQRNEKTDVNGDYICNIHPYPSVYEDYQINCFRFYDGQDSSAPEENINVLTFDEVRGICDWIETCNDAEILPEITGESVTEIECIPPVPQIRYVNHAENIIAFFITVRVRYVNRARQRVIERECQA